MRGKRLVSRIVRLTFAGEASSDWRGRLVSGNPPAGRRPIPGTPALRATPIKGTPLRLAPYTPERVCQAHEAITGARRRATPAVARITVERHPRPSRDELIARVLPDRPSPS